MRSERINSIVGAMVGIDPKDELEGMLAAQLIASHNAAMDCYRRANFEGQTSEGRSEALTQANKLSRTYTSLLESLNRHRGKGQQKMTVEHVRVYEGGQAIVGQIGGEAGGGVQVKSRVQPHASIPFSAQPEMRSKDPQRQLVPAGGHAKRALPNARRTVTRRTKGNKNRRVHGRYSAESIERRRAISALLRSARDLLEYEPRLRHEVYSRRASRLRAVCL
jgi:hypothetical protein